VLVEAACIQPRDFPAPDCVQKRGVLRTTLVRSIDASFAEALTHGAASPLSGTQMRFPPPAGRQQKITFALITYDDF
jgi:hypothetical protein